MTIVPANRGRALILLTAVYAMHNVDTSMINLLLQPIKEDLQLSDTQLGMVTGIAFAFFYATLGLPIARWADRGNRVTIAAGSIALWGLTAMACLFVASFPQLIAARVAAAIGESGCKPASYSLVGDYFPQPGERTRAMSIYWLGNPLAALFSFALGGWLNERYGWRVALFLVGLPALLLAVAVKLLVKEPRAALPPAAAGKPSVAAVVATLWRQKSSRHLILALTLLYTMGFGLGPWYAAFMIRSHGMGTAELGALLGPIFGFGGIAGTLLGGYVGSRCFAQAPRAQLRISALAVVAAMPFFIAFLALPQRYAALAALLPYMIVLSVFFAPTYALLQRLVPAEMRATTLALVLLVTNLVGMGLGRQMVGTFSDLLAADLGRDSLRYAMLALSLVSLWAAWHFWRVGRTVERDLAATGVAYP